ncbi:MAG TPA: hypothetical protein VNX23_15920 [Bradyrhizobium sp.]|jgi:hypothetical protein|uniref:hypothetical protein n=1 Tax=Bradyrhizobium sp. TaxID=376 RepID=UPI002C871331|nr:hypothetical protein [Bradyrhizobium sp.]HXB78861.1 hypothetical protein [Bradyrhizobium sp.]
MRTVVILIALVATTPAHASKSCMTMAEARQQFSTSHLFWHGSGHCWDATAPRQRLARIKPSEDQNARRDSRSPLVEEPKWRNAMSEMLAADTPIGASDVPTSIAAIEMPGMDWLDRWVDVVQVASPVVSSRDEQIDISPTAGRKADPTITPVGLILMLTGLLVTLAVIELLFRNLIHDWRR